MPANKLQGIDLYSRHKDLDANLSSKITLKTDYYAAFIFN